MFEDILLQPEQRELLIKLVEAARSVTPDQRQPFFAFQTFGGDSVVHPGVPDGEMDAYFGDVEILASAGLLRLSYGSPGSSSFDITPLGFAYHDHLNKLPQQSATEGPDAIRYEINLPARIRTLAKRLFARETGLSSRQVVEFFCQYSDDIPDYPWSPPLAYRAEYFDRCLAYLPPGRQVEVLLSLCDYGGPYGYGAPSPEDIDRLRQSLMALEAPFDDAAKLLDEIGWPYVQTQWRKATQRVNSDPEGAITAARSLVETVCKHILGERAVEYKDDGDLVRLYKLTARQLALAPDRKAEECLRQMLGGCASIVSGSAGLRNTFGDSHGKDKSYSGAEQRHARLAVNAAGSLSMFLIETHHQQP